MHIGRSSTGSRTGATRATTTIEQTGRLAPFRYYEFENWRHPWSEANASWTYVRRFSPNLCGDSL
jgi:hypothetical protein